MGAHGFSGKKLGPTWGTVYRKWKIKNHCQDSKDRSKKCKQLQKGYKRNTQITNNRIKIIHKIICTDESGRRWRGFTIIKFLTKFVYLTRKLWSQESFCKPTILLSVKRRIPVSYQIDSGSACSILPVRNVFRDISGVYNLNANKPALFNYDEETINLDTGNQKSLSLSGVNPETNEEVIIQFRIVERDLATLIGLNDYETLRLIEVLRRSRACS